MKRKTRDHETEMPPIPDTTQPQSLPGQRDLLAPLNDESQVHYLRRCNRCGDLDQARQPVVYDPRESPSGCPVCLCPEFTLMAQDADGKVRRWDPAIDESPETKSQKGRHDMPTKSLSKPKPVPAARSKTGGPAAKPTKQTKKPQAAGLNVMDDSLDEMRHLAVDQIQPSPDQPRKEFDEQAMQELADSIAAQGVLEPLLVRPCGGIFELVAGERRWRAAQMAGKKTVPCRIKWMTDGEVELARLTENLLREDLTAIEEAMGFLRAIEQLGCTQEALAKKLGKSQGQICNTMRLLRLPADWQAKIISREMTPTQARDLVPWADLPAVLDEMKHQFKNEHEGRFANLSPGEWGDLLETALDRCSEPVEGTKYGNGVQFKFDLAKCDAKTLEELDVRTYRGALCGEQTACFNVKLWEKLVAQIGAKAKQAAEKKVSREVDGPAASNGKTKAAAVAEKSKAELAAEAQEKAEQLAKRLYRYKIAWQQKQIARGIGHVSDDELQLIVMGMMVTGSTQVGERFQRLRAACQQPGLPPFKGDAHRELDVWPWVMGLDRGKLRSVLLVFVELTLKLEARSWSRDVNPAWVESLARTLDIDWKDWRADEDFLKLHTADQLRDLMVEWKMSCMSDKKGEMIKHVMDHLTLAKAPKSLLTVAACELV